MEIKRKKKKKEREGGSLYLNKNKILKKKKRKGEWGTTILRERLEKEMPNLMMFCVNINGFEKRSKSSLSFVIGVCSRKKEKNIYRSKNLHKIGLENLKYGMYRNFRY